jgi:predicted phage tail protein
MPTPKAPTGPQDPDASKYFGSQGNTVAIGTPIGIAYGRIPRYGQILALNVDAQDLVRGSFPASP